MKKHTRNYVNLLIFALIVFGLIFVIFNSKALETPPSPFEKYYAGDVRHFRANLQEAQDVSVYPSEDAIRGILLNPDVYKVYIAYFPNETENAYYAASSFEIGNKLGIIYKNLYQGDCNVSTEEEKDGSTCLLFCYTGRKCFNSLPINSTDELVPTDVEPVILLLGSSHANRTAVTIDNYLITVEGNTFSEQDKPYSNLDLAVAKLILTLMV